MFLFILKILHTPILLQLTAVFFQKSLFILKKRYMKLTLELRIAEFF